MRRMTDQQGRRERRVLVAICHSHRDLPGDGSEASEARAGPARRVIEFAAGPPPVNCRSPNIRGRAEVPSGRVRHAERPHLLHRPDELGKGPAAASGFYAAAFGLGTQVRLRASAAPTTGFRGFTLNLGVSQPAIELVLYGRGAAAKDAGVSPDGTGSHRIVISSDAGPFTDPDGFVWEAARLSPAEP
jgi:hypothetical protein